MHTFVHVEIPAVDLRRAQAFYGKIFGWTFQQFDKDYALINAPSGESIGGIYRAQKDLPKPDRKRPIVRAYVQVEDIDAKLKDVRRARGTVLDQKQPVPGMGWWASFADPQGGMIYLWQPMQAQEQEARETQAMQERNGRVALMTPA